MSEEREMIRVEEESERKLEIEARRLIDCSLSTEPTKNETELMAYQKISNRCYAYLHDII